jgi:flagellar hook-basal body complex protein FliE
MSMRASVLVFVLLVGCHNAETDVEHDELSAEMFRVATTYKSTMCDCKTAQCADDVDARFQSWLKQMLAKVEDSDHRNSYSATIGETGIKRFDGIVDAYNSCKTDLQVRAAIGR